MLAELRLILSNVQGDSDHSNILHTAWREVYVFSVAWWEARSCGRHLQSHSLDIWTADWSTWPKWSIKYSWFEKEDECWYLEVGRGSVLTSQGPATVSELEAVRQSLITMRFLRHQPFLVQIFIFERGKDLWFGSFECFHEVFFLGKQHLCGSSWCHQPNWNRCNPDVIKIWLFQD